LNATLALVQTPGDQYLSIGQEHSDIGISRRNQRTGERIRVGREVIQNGFDGEAASTISISEVPKACVKRFPDAEERHGRTAVASWKGTNASPSTGGSSQWATIKKLLQFRPGSIFFALSSIMARNLFVSPVAGSK
jgi:hypothetical protein